MGFQICERVDVDTLRSLKTLRDILADRRRRVQEFRLAKLQRHAQEQRELREALEMLTWRD